MQVPKTYVNKCGVGIWECTFILAVISLKKLKVENQRKQGRILEWKSLVIYYSSPTFVVIASNVCTQSANGECEHVLRRSRRRKFSENWCAKQDITPLAYYIVVVVGVVVVVVVVRKTLGVIRRYIDCGIHWHWWVYVHMYIVLGTSRAKQHFLVELNERK